MQTFVLPDCQADEQSLCQQFDQPDQNRKWREGNIKSSFNYLLLDPRSPLYFPDSLLFFGQSCAWVWDNVFLVFEITGLKIKQYLYATIGSAVTLYESLSQSLLLTNMLSFDISFYWLLLGAVWRSLDVPEDKHLSPSACEKLDFFLFFFFALSPEWRITCHSAATPWPYRSASRHLFMLYFMWAKGNAPAPTATFMRPWSTTEARKPPK